MCASLHTKFQVCSIILTSSIQGVILSPLPQNEPLKSPPSLGLRLRILRNQKLIKKKKLKLCGDTDQCPVCSQKSIFRIKGQNLRKSRYFWSCVISPDFLTLSQMFCLGLSEEETLVHNSSESPSIINILRFLITSKPFSRV